MNFSSEPIPDSENQPSFRNRRKRSFFPDYSDNSRIDFITQLAHRVEPTFDFFLFSLLAGAVFSLGYLLNAPAFLVIGALLVPFMAPVIGLSLSAAIGSFRFFIVSFAGLLVGIFLIFMTGLVGGLASPLFPANPATSSDNGLLIHWDLFAAYLFGVGLTTLSLIKSEQTPVLPSAMLSYALLTQVSLVGFAVGQGNIELALQTVAQVGWYLLAGLVIGAVIFWGFAFKPGHPIPYLMVLLGFVGVVGAGWIFFKPDQFKFLPTDFSWPASVGKTETKTEPVETPVEQATFTETLWPTSTPSLTASLTPSVTASATRTPLETSIAREFVWAMIAADGQSGARIREHPSFDGKVIRILDNALLVKLMPGEEYRDKVWWSKVKLIDGTIGWMVRSVLITTTPVPTENISPTP